MKRQRKTGKGERHLLGAIWTRISARYRGEEFRLTQFNRFAVAAMEHLKIPGRPDFISGTDSRGLKVYVMRLDWNGDLPQSTLTALHAYMHRKLEQVFKINRKQFGFEIAIRNHSAELAVDESKLSSAWLTEQIQRAKRLPSSLSNLGEDDTGSDGSWLQDVPHLATEAIEANIAERRAQLERENSQPAPLRRHSPTVLEDDPSNPGSRMPNHYLGIQENRGLEGILTGYAGLWEQRSPAKDDTSTQPMCYEDSTQQFRGSKQ